MPDPIDPNTPIPGRCNAKRTSGPGLCRKKSLWPDGAGGGRCELHGGKSTGPRTAAGKAKVSVNAIQHGATGRSLSAWERHVRSKYTAEELEVYDSVPTTLDLTPEIRTQRMKCDEMERQRKTCQAKVKEFGSESGLVNMLQAEDVVTKLRDRAAECGLFLSKDGLLLHDTISLQRWTELEQLVKDNLRKLLATQREINPGSKAKGNVHFTISATAEVQAKAEEPEEIPELTDEAPEEDGMDLETDAPEEQEDAPPKKGILDGIEP